MGEKHPTRFGGGVRRRLPSVGTRSEFGKTRAEFRPKVLHGVLRALVLGFQAGNGFGLVADMGQKHRSWKFNPDAHGLSYGRVGPSYGGVWGRTNP